MATKPYGAKGLSWGTIISMTLLTALSRRTAYVKNCAVLKGKILLLDVELFDEKIIILQGKYFEFRSEQG